ncbi:MAG: radical SAM family heme chaperone HemW [Chloroflexota bacterium]|nr:radical SAM family heme chaperone HemW [Chloroflexota bacterium]
MGNKPNKQVVEPLGVTTASEKGRSISSGIALYIHIPFCETKCPYCDFNTYAGINHLIPSYIGALTNELRIWAKTLEHPRVNNMFLGGGTPSMLSANQMHSLLSLIRSEFAVQADAEVTAEVNPDDVNFDRLSGFRDAGINRISMGVQSFSNSELHLLGRRHEVSHVLNAFETIQNAGITNISMDLMYGLPHQTIETWERNIKAVITAAPQHISAYALTLEPETPMAHWVSKGTLPEQDSDLAADMYEWASVELAKAGYRNYEISNWALPGRESRHNIIYWRNLPYLGVGPGAHSFLGGYRFANGKSPLTYIAKVNAWSEPPVNLEVLLRESPGYVEDIEPMDRKTEMADSLIMGLRLADGVRNQDFQERFGLNLHEAYGDAIKETISLGLLRSSGMWPHATIRLTERGKLLANEAFLRFLGD